MCVPPRSGEQLVDRVRLCSGLGKEPVAARQVADAARMVHAREAAPAMTRVDREGAAHAEARVAGGAGPGLGLGPESQWCPTSGRCKLKANELTPWPSLRPSSHTTSGGCCDCYT